MTSNGSKAQRFSQLRLGNWRNFAHVKVLLQGRVFLIGPNASGKSNFLDSFRFLHDLVALGGGFEEAIAKRGGVSRLRSLVPPGAIRTSKSESPWAVEENRLIGNTSSASAKTIGSGPS
jgi:predicted ATPase